MKSAGLALAGLAAWLALGAAWAQGPAAGAASAGAAAAALGSLEQQAVEAALAARGLRLDPAPLGKRVGVIHVVNHEVFSPRDSYLQLLNIFHRTTREWVIRREVLLAPGDAYDPLLVEETVRNLRDADFSSLVVILPVDSGQPGVVDLLVVTRDVWSLRLNSDFEFQEQVLTFLTLSLSENNLFGWRKKAAVVFNLYQGHYTLGPVYVDPNVAGTRLTFSGGYAAFFNRDTREQEGNSVNATLRYPLYALSRRWGAGVSASYSDWVARLYNRGGLVGVDLGEVAPGTVLPWIYRERRGGVSSSVVRSFGKAVIQRLSFGHSLSVVRPRFYEGFPTDPVVRAAFAEKVFPRSERLSALFLSYNLFTPTYRVYRDYHTYDLREDFQLGPGLFFEVGRAASWLGSEDTYTRLSGSAAWNFDLLDGFQRFSVGWGGRFRRGDFVDETRSASLTLTTPTVFGLGRLVSEAGVVALHRSTRANAFYYAGGESGLRGYGLNEFRGLARLLGHVELRSAPLALAALRFGAVLFYDFGHAAPRLADLRPRQDLGAGLRLLIPQLNFYVLRVDWAFPLQVGNVSQGGLATQPGWPGRVSAGFQQVF